jgi:tetratricopeptide (TPR) repeat protein
LKKVRQLIDECQFQEARTLIRQFEKENNLIPEEQITFLILKGDLYRILGRYEDALNLSETAFDMSNSIGNKLLSFDSLFIKMQSLIDTYMIDEAYQTLNRLNKIFESLQNASHDKILQKEADLTYISARIYTDSTKFEQAEESFKKYLEIREKIGNKAKIAQAFRYISYLFLFKQDFTQALKFGEMGLAIKEIYKSDKSSILALMAGVCFRKGELDLALRYNKEHIRFAKEINLKGWIASGLRQRAIIYRLKGDLFKAIQYLERGLSLIEKTGVLINNLGILGLLIEFNLDRGSLEEAKKYLDQYKQLAKKEKNLYINQALNLSIAVFLKKSKNLRDRLKAEMLLKQYLDEESPIKVHATTSLWKLEMMAHLCDLLLTEFRRSNDLGLLDEIKPLLTEFKNLAEQQNSYWRLAEVNLLEAKLALIQTNMGEAKRLLTEAQKIADDHGLGLLAQQISNEHDKLLEQMEILEDFKEKKVPISERLKVVSIEEVVERILDKRAVEPSKIVDEEPILLMIIAEGGVLLLSYAFHEEWKNNNELLGSFMSAFSSFSDEFFSEELDRVKFGQYTVLMKAIPNFSICYVFKGQSYLAKQKLTHFTNRIQNNRPIAQTLNNFFQKSQVIEIKEFPFLEAFIAEIFTPTDQISENLIN